MGVPDSYWQSELGEAQESYRFFMQSRLNLLSYSYGALIAVLSLWGSQLDTLQDLDPPWLMVAAIAASASFAALVVVFLLAESVGLNWGNAVGNHMQRWVLAARELGGDEGWEMTKTALETHPTPVGSIHLSAFAMGVLARLGLASACLLSVGVPLVGASAVSGNLAGATAMLAAVPPAAALALVLVVWLQRSSRVRRKVSERLRPSARKRLGERVGQLAFAIWLLVAIVLWASLAAMALAV